MAACHLSIPIESRVQKPADYLHEDVKENGSKAVMYIASADLVHIPLAVLCFESIDSWSNTIKNACRYLFWYLTSTGSLHSGRSISTKLTCPSLAAIWSGVKPFCMLLTQQSTCRLRGAWLGLRKTYIYPYADDVFDML
jgi:hypothetical protein